MITIDNAILSDDIAEKMFVCHLEKCKGACCEIGDLGAPLTQEELPILEEIYETVKPYLSQEGINAIDKQGKYVLDSDGEYSTPMIKGAACVYATKEKNGTWACGIEKAYLDEKIAFKKPISCHLYPIRITKYDEFEALNYHRWDICAPACSFGEKLGVPLYRFLKEALIRKYGEDWYNRLVAEIEKTDKQNT
jgi:hypothetical protein